jgi:hypothetical protein
MGSRNSKKEYLTSRIHVLKEYMKKNSGKVKENVIKSNNRENESSNQIFAQGSFHRLLPF